MTARRSGSTVPTRPDRRSPARAARQQRADAGRQRRLVLLAAGGVVLVLAVMVAARLLTSGGSSAAAEGPVPPEVMTDLTSVPASTFEAVGQGGVQNLPTPVRGPVQRGPSGLPVVTYIGAEYCPFCAAERWSLIVALSRFGSFSGLRLSHSAGDDVYPNTPTFSFYGATYTSPYVEFDAVELQTNVRSGGTYTTLQTPTPAQESLLRTYDAPPYVPAGSAGAIPFLDIAGQYMMSGASYDTGLLRGLSQAHIAAMLADGTSSQARAIIGTTNILTAAVCSATGSSPAEVCQTPAVQSLGATLAALPAPTRAP